MGNDDSETLYCVGCGRAVATSKPGQVLAIACVCGANAPILHTKDHQCAPPLSLVQATGIVMPHLEYYLGFSEHQSPLKIEVTRMLRALGSISYTECTNSRCRESFERSKQNYQAWVERTKPNGKESKDEQDSP